MRIQFSLRKSRVVVLDQDAEAVLGAVAVIQHVGTTELSFRDPGLLLGDPAKFTAWSEAAIDAVRRQVQSASDLHYEPSGRVPTALVVYTGKPDLDPRTRVQVRHCIDELLIRQGFDDGTEVRVRMRLPEDEDVWDLEMWAQEPGYMPCRFASMRVSVGGMTDAEFLAWIANPTILPQPEPE
jgi:hypothetical protein